MSCVTRDTAFHVKCIFYRTACNGGPSDVDLYKEVQFQHAASMLLRSFQSFFDFSCVITSTIDLARFKTSLICFTLVEATMARNRNTTMYTCENTSEAARQTVAPQVASVNHRTMNEAIATKMGNT